MDHCASVLLGFPQNFAVGNNELYHSSVRSHIHKLDKMMKDSTVAFQSIADKFFDVVHPAEHSISYLALISTVLARDNLTNPALLEPITRFLMTFDARQIRYVGPAFSALLTAVANGRIFPASISVDLLATALLRIDPSGSILTSHHIALANLAYDSNNISAALPVIEKTIVFYPGVKSTNTKQHPSDMSLSPISYITPDSGLTAKLTSSLVLQYDLLCGMCFIQQRSWQQAFDALERVVTYPTKDNGCSKIMVEAHNKWLLVGLLLTGKTPTLPSITMPGVQKSYQTLGKPYASICKAFESDKADSLKSEYESLGNQFWAQEGNLGLMRLVIAHYQRWRILRLRDVYTKISLEQIRARTQSAETGESLTRVSDIENLVQSMIDEGMLKGVIEKPVDDDKPAHLVFLTDDEELSEVEFAERMASTAQRIKDLGPVVKATNERLATSQDYLRFVVKEQKKEMAGGGMGGRHAGGGGGGGGGGMFSSQIDDEDLMTGIISGH